jgi:cellulose synthase/poly-beta-1,6-N-acetylglucosamine synthase-like glycosyltransferase
LSRLLFWLASGLIGWTYVGFPAVVLARGRLRPRPHRSEPITPSVSIVIAARNEEASIGAKLDNLAALDYPAERLEVLIASDGSDDATNRIVGERAGPRLQLLALPRVGKAAALNAAVAEARGEVLVFSDANSMFAPDAIRRLVEPFADPQVGGVAGDQRYASDDAAGGGEAAVAGGERSYWSLDRALKLAESRGGHVISATGAIYAVRRSLFREVPAAVTDDFATSTGVIAQGRRLVFAPDAVAYEAVGATAEVEFSRKVRVMTRGLNGVRVRSELLNPRRHGFYALQLFSHKVLRRLMAVPLLVMAVTSTLLRRSSPFYALASAGQLGLYAVGVLGLLAGRRPRARSKLVAAPTFFVMVNVASLQAVLNVVRGRDIAHWEPVSRAGAEPAGEEAPAA